eukprot:4514281-Amphidinium_carterae.1
MCSGSLAHPVMPLNGCPSRALCWTCGTGCCCCCRHLKVSTIRGRDDGDGGDGCLILCIPLRALPSGTMLCELCFVVAVQFLTAKPQGSLAK